MTWRFLVENNFSKHMGRPGSSNIFVFFRCFSSILRKKHVSKMAQQLRNLVVDVVK